MTNLERRSDNLRIKFGLKTKKILMNENLEKYLELVRILDSLKREGLGGDMDELQEKFKIEAKFTKIISENFPQLTDKYNVVVKKKDNPYRSYTIYDSTSRSYTIYLKVKKSER